MLQCIYFCVSLSFFSFFHLLDVFLPPPPLNDCCYVFAATTATTTTTTPLGRYGYGWKHSDVGRRASDQRSQSGRTAATTRRLSVHFSLTYVHVLNLVSCLSERKLHGYRILFF